ncbi:MAG: hypothetical protein Q7V01_13180 [Vicinamibacterales bacterium]|nr:hypothetical protein [Vicinamibacterales bacterium]
MRVNSRRLPLWLAAWTMTATWVDGGYLLGTVEGVSRSSVASGLQGGLCFGLSLMIGGMWSVAYTDTIQLAMVVVGLAIALPFALSAVGGLGQAWEACAAARPGASRPLMPCRSCSRP